MTDKILIGRSVAQQVGLQVLEALDEIAWSNDTKWQSDRADSVRLVLRATLEQQGEQEPVAWISPSALEWITRESEKLVKLTRKAQPEYDFTEPLYTKPHPPRQPLSEMEIVELRQLTPGTLDVQFVKFARAVEAAHNIKEQK